MAPFPHHYRAQACAGPRGAVRVGAAGVASSIDTDAPPEFGGPQGRWSPETLLVAAIADCFVLSFRAVARASRLEWLDLAVDVEGTLDRANGAMRFVHLRVTPTLTLVDPADAEKALAVLDKAHRSCLVTNSLAAPCELLPRVVSAEAGAVT